jgi:hypothetical protein
VVACRLKAAVRVDFSEDFLAAVLCWRWWMGVLEATVIVAE